MLIDYIICFSVNALRLVVMEFTLPVMNLMPDVYTNYGLLLMYCWIVITPHFALISACPVTCENDGTLNVVTCTCDCADGYNGDTCRSECIAGHLLLLCTIGTCVLNVYYILGDALL